MEPFRALRCNCSSNRDKVLTMNISLLLLLAALLSSPACAAVCSRESDREHCPVTQPAADAFVPPQPWPEEPPDPSRFWYGEPGLWTSLPLSGEWAQLADWDKFLMWSQKFDVHEDETPDFVVSARRLDGKASDFHSEETTNAYHPRWHWAMLTGAHVARPGCWRFDVTYKDQTLDFVVWVPAP
jgi:hypothetical protein